MAARMQAILARDVANLGHVGEVVKVAPGYLRNYLLPKRLAYPVSKARLEQFEHQKKIIMHQLAKLKASSEALRDRIEVPKFTIEVKSGEQGKLFGSVGSRDIETVLNEHGFEIHHRDIKLESPLKTIGLHEVPVRLEGGVMAKVKVVLAKEEAEAKKEEEQKKEAEPLEQSAGEGEDVSEQSVSESEEAFQKNEE